MTTRIRVTTHFDCTVTGVTGHFRATALPFTDQEGQTIQDQATWNRSRNQQRNWETILQIIGLYTQAQDLSPVERIANGWQFEFSTDFDDVFADRGDPLGLLKKASQGVPVFDNLDLVPTTAVLDPDTNITFEIVDHK